jgi:RNA polymerase sigma-70 factor (ECF subfamily)
MSHATHTPPPAQCTPETCAQCARRNGCKACLEELVRRFQSPLLHFLSRRTGSRHDAEDLLQEAFMIACRNIHRYRAAWKFSTWLFTIANNLAASAWRRKNRGGSNGSRPVERVSDVNPLADAQQNELHGNLWDAARQILDADSFTAVWLSYVESMPANEIGRVLGRSANAARILLHRARARLASELVQFQGFAESPNETK